MAKPPRRLSAPPTVDRRYLRICGAIPVPDNDRIFAFQGTVGTYQGRNSWSSGRTIGYRGPAPPPGHGTHHYHFKLYALDTELELNPGIDKAELLRQVSGHIQAEAELVGTYER